MKKIKKNKTIKAAGLLMMLFFFTIIITNLSCNLMPNNNLQTHLVPDTTGYANKISLNVLFTEGISLKQKNITIQNIKDSIIQFYTLINLAYYSSDFIPHFDNDTWCPCDSTLININFHCIDGAGKSKASPKPTTPVPGQGSLLGVLSISNNNTISDSTNKETKKIVFKSPSKARNIITDPSKIIAIIDSGIDTALFDLPMENLMWSDPTGKPTLYNFLSIGKSSDFSDGGHVKHGSAVTSLALEAMKSARLYPKLMILKALDENEEGSVFTVSCALSYAIQKNATLVNASLGYKGDPEPVLQHYIERCASHTPQPIQLFVAAGNTTGQHDNSKICDGNFNANFLHKNNFMFYPACFSSQFNNITSVTQIHTPDEFCHYQYYSKDYISLGVLNTKDCCSFEVSFKNGEHRFYEGSSFATPVASGIKMSSMINPQIPGATISNWDKQLKTAPLKLITKEGKYLIYKQD